MLPCWSLMKRSPLSMTSFSHHGALAYAASSRSPRCWTRAVKSLMNGVISGLKKTVGGTVVATERGLNAVVAIQYRGIMLTTSMASASAIAVRFHQRDLFD